MPLPDLLCQDTGSRYVDVSASVCGLSVQRVILVNLTYVNMDHHHYNLDTSLGALIHPKYIVQLSATKCASSVLNDESSQAPGVLLSNCNTSLHSQLVHLIQ